jgi:hypothetical protein
MSSLCRVRCVVRTCRTWSCLLAEKAEDLGSPCGSGKMRVSLLILANSRKGSGAPPTLKRTPCRGQVEHCPIGSLGRLYEFGQWKRTWRPQSGVKMKGRKVMIRFSALVGLGVLLAASGLRAGPMPSMPELPQPTREGPVQSDGFVHGDQGPACCSGERCHGGCVHRFCEWLTYKPLTRPCLCDCCHHKCGCCYPPLYTFFLCQDCNGPYGHGGPPCGCGAPAPIGPVTLAAPVPASQAPGVGPYSAPPQAPTSASASAWSNRAFTLVSHRTQQ